MATVVTTMSSVSVILTLTRHGGHIVRAQASCAGEGSSVSDRVKPMTYTIDTCRFLAWHSGITRIGQGLVSSVSR